MRVFFGVVLILVTLLAGGCSLFFAVAFLFDSNTDWAFVQAAAMFFVPGFLIAGLAAFFARKLLSKPKPPEPDR